VNSPHDDEADLRDREFPDETDLDDAGEPSVDLETCPYCGKAVYAQADICPHCRSFISFGAPPPRPLWIIVTALVGILLVLTWVLLRWAPSFGRGPMPEVVAEASTPRMGHPGMMFTAYR
jgi:hypothetical protein